MADLLLCNMRVSERVAISKARAAGMCLCLVFITVSLLPKDCEGWDTNQPTEFKL